MATGDVYRVLVPCASPAHDSSSAWRRGRVQSENEANRGNYPHFSGVAQKSELTDLWEGGENEKFS